MTKNREVLRMQAGGFSQREIAAVLKLSRNTVAKVVTGSPAKRAGLGRN